MPPRFWGRPARSNDGEDAPEAETGDDDSIEDFHDPRSSTRSRGFNQERLTIEQLEALSSSAKADYDKRRRAWHGPLRLARKAVLRTHGFVDDRLALAELLTRSLALFTAADMREAPLGPDLLDTNESTWEFVDAARFECAKN